jgi:hypothetical protein
MAKSPSQQPALFAEQDDEAMLLPQPEIAKRYSGKIADKLEFKRNAILMLLGAGYPVDTISVQLHANKRTVTELAKRCAEKVARFNKEFADILLSTGSRWVGLARTKEDGASFRDLTIGAGIVMQHARDLLAMGETGEKEIVQEAEDHAAAAARLREWFDAGAAQVERSSALQSNPQALISNGLDIDGSQRVGVGARPGQLVQVEAGAGAVVVAGREGGGSDDRMDGNNLMGEVSGDCSAKGSGTRQGTPPAAVPALPAGPAKNAAPPAARAAGATPGGEP